MNKSKNLLKFSKELSSEDSRLVKEIESLGFSQKKEPNKKRLYSTKKQYQNLIDLNSVGPFSKSNTLPEAHTAPHTLEFLTKSGEPRLKLTVTKFPLGYNIVFTSVPYVSKYNRYTGSPIEEGKVIGQIEKYLKEINN